MNYLIAALTTLLTIASVLWPEVRDVLRDGQVHLAGEDVPAEFARIDDLHLYPYSRRVVDSRGRATVPRATAGAVGRADKRPHLPITVNHRD